MSQIVYAAEEPAKSYHLLVPLSPEDPTGADTTGFEYFSTVYSFALTLTVALAVIMIVIGGVQYTLAYIPSAKSSAKDRITGAIGGLLLALFSWLILNTINPKLVEPTISFPILPELPPPGPPPPDTGGGGTPIGTLTHKQATDYLDLNHVGYKSSVDFGGVQRYALDAVISVNDDCDLCKLKITSALDGDHDPKAGHLQGEKVDVSLDSELEKYIRANFDDDIGPSPKEKYERFVDPETNAIWMLEPDHWDVDAGDVGSRF